MTRLTLSRTSWAATFASFSRTNETTTCETPSDEFEVSVSMPLMVLTASSTLSVTSVSICSGAAPGRRVVTTTDRDVDVREAIDAEPREREQSDDDEREDQDPGEDRALDAEFGEPLHGVSSPLSRGRRP